MTHPDDALDFKIHCAIERLITTYMNMRAMTREAVIAELYSGNEMFAHGLQAICEMCSIERAELNDRISAFIESEREEEAERAAAAIALACNAEGEGVS